MYCAMSFSMLYLSMASCAASKKAMSAFQALVVMSGVDRAKRTDFNSLLLHLLRLRSLISLPVDTGHLSGWYHVRRLDLGCRPVLARFSEPGTGRAYLPASCPSSPSPHRRPLLQPCLRDLGLLRSRVLQAGRGSNVVETAFREAQGRMLSSSPVRDVSTCRLGKSG